MAYRHIPVMQAEVLFCLNCEPGKIYVDGTLGGGGHSKAILKKIIPDGLLIGCDQDLDAIENAKKAFKRYAANIHLFHGNFIRLPEYLLQLNIDAVDGILLDLGVSLHQLESSGRGFSFKRDEPLDMRMDITSSSKAVDIVNKTEEENLRKIFKKYGEERWARRIARKIVTVRKHQIISSSKQLAEIVCTAVPKGASFSQRIHPATRVFMALRIVVNRELEMLESFLDKAVDYLNPKGRLCVLSFHSLEDRIVKHQIKTLEKECVCPPDFPKCVCSQKKMVRSLSKRVIRPSKDEIAINPMARSTRLRAFEKL
ncbi:16S rRNA (cytosine(1402)-N(4))-methyltransferase RsmH [Thermodesulfobacteriota bacterium]